MRAHVNNALVSDLLPAKRRPVIIARPDESLQSVLETMQREKILSVPVYASNSADDEACHHFFDMLDLVAMILQLSDGNVAVGEAKNKSRTDVYLPIQAELGLYSLTEIFSRGIHRVPVVSASGKVEAVVSQSDVLHFLARHMSEEDTELDKTLQEAGVTGNAVVAQIGPECSLRDGLKILSERAFEAVPIEGGSGACLAAESLRGMQLEEIRKLLDSSVGSFVASHPSNSISIEDESTSVRQLMQRMSESRAHHAWVLKGDNVISVVSLGDLLRFSMKIASHVK